MDPVLFLQGNPDSSLTPLYLIHAISGFALPYARLGDLNPGATWEEDQRPVYGISSPLYESKKYRMPNDINDIATQYVDLIRREVQPEGPYLLGGWSMGGMIAVKMAKIMQDQGQKVLHVVLIDSLNPEHNLSFQSRFEHLKMSETMFEAVASRTPAPRTGWIDPSGDRSSSVSSMSTSSASASASSSSNGSPECSGSDSDDVPMDDLFTRMWQHITKGLEIISKVQPGDLVTDRCETEVTLVKCTSSAAPGKTSTTDIRQKFGQGYWNLCMDWDTSKFDWFQVGLRGRHP